MELALTEPPPSFDATWLAELYPLAGYSLVAFLVLVALAMYSPPPPPRFP